MYNVDIREPIPQQITIPDFADGCKHLSSAEYTSYQNTLFTKNDKMINIECNTRSQSGCSQWFMKDKLV